MAVEVLVCVMAGEALGVNDKLFITGTLIVSKFKTAFKGIRTAFTGVRTKNGHWSYISAIFNQVPDLLFFGAFDLLLLQGLEQGLLHSLMLNQSNDIKEANASRNRLFSMKIY
jgi:hypothetical protein